MEKEEGFKMGLSLANRATIVMLGTLHFEGYPDVRAMVKNENEGLKTIWLTTNTSSQKIQEIQRNPNACLYFVDFDNWMGLKLIGGVEILQDPESKQRFWREGFEKYYPLGASDLDYSILRFTSRWGNYYHNLANVSFAV